MCKKLCVFAGTTEGRELIELLEGESVSVTACVAAGRNNARQNPIGRNISSILYFR